MRVVTAADLAQVFTYPAVIEALRTAFVTPVVTPVRHHHPVERAGEPNAMLLLMPAWSDLSTSVGDGAVLGVKIVSVIPGNAGRALPSVVGAYVLFDGITGAPLAVMDGAVLTLWRTASASALAAEYLARQDAGTLLMVGSGALAPHLVKAHCAVRPIRDVMIWNRTLEKAETLAAELAAEGVPARAVADLEPATRSADVISCATLSAEPIIRGEWLRPGAHLDLVGGFTPRMRETDDTAIRRASVFVDTLAGATKEAGDITQPLASGALDRDAIRGDLFGLCAGSIPGRTSADEITLFKSVGTAIEDLAAARLAAELIGLR